MLKNSINEIMKKLITSVFFAGIVATAMISCDDEVVSKKHVYTEAEIKLRDSLEAAKNNMKANYTFTYDIMLPFDAANYSGIEVAVDQAILLDKLGFTTLEEFTTATGTVEGGVQVGQTVTFFAFNRSTGADYKQGFTAAGLGHWFDVNGDVCSWGETAMLFSEFDATTAKFLIGQYPNRLVDGNTYKIVQMMQKASYRIAFVFNVTVGDDYVDPETPPSGTPKTVEKEFTVEQTFASDWSANTQLDVKSVLRDAFKMTTYQIHKAIDEGELVFKGLNADGSFHQDEEGNPVSTANAPGHWFALSGDVTVWGDATNKPEVYSELTHTNESLGFSIGLHPENAKAGDEVTFKQVAELNGGKVTFIFHFKVN